MKSTKVQTLGVIRVQLYSSIKIHIDPILERRPTHRSGKCSSIANFTSFGSLKVDTSTIYLRSSTQKREGGNIAPTTTPNIVHTHMHNRSRYITATPAWPHKCTWYVLNAYLYCVYALVGGAISIRDPYIYAVSRVCANESHAVFHGPVVCAVKT